MNNGFIMNQENHHLENAFDDSDFEAEDGNEIDEASEKCQF